MGEFKKIFRNGEDVLLKLKEIMEESPSPRLKDLFTIIYNQVAKEHNEKQKRENPDDDENSFGSDINGYSDEETPMNDPEAQKLLEEKLRKKKEDEKIKKAKEDLRRAGIDNGERDESTNQRKWQKINFGKIF